MSDLSIYESRTGTLSCTSDEVYNFVTDIRNFGQFIPDGTITDWQAESDACSFRVSVVGVINVRIAGKEPYGKVIFNGDALKKNDFSLVLNISNGKNDSAEVKILLEAELNPVLRMMAGKPIVQFLEILIREMENFREWRNLKFQTDHL
jgi:carbon monoxide dehydrogenase subunit G